MSSALSSEALHTMIAHARRIGDSALEKKLLHELHQAAEAPPEVPQVLSSDVEESTIEALQEAVAANARDPSAWIELARAHMRRRDWHEAVLAAFPAAILHAWPAGHAEVAKGMLGRCVAMLLPKGWLPTANNSLGWVADALARATPENGRGRVDRLRVCGVGVAAAAVNAVADRGHGRDAQPHLRGEGHLVLLEPPRAEVGLEAIGARPPRAVEVHLRGRRARRLQKRARREEKPDPPRPAEVLAPGPDQEVAPNLPDVHGHLAHALARVQEVRGAVFLRDGADALGGVD